VSTIDQTRSQPLAPGHADPRAQVYRGLYKYGQGYWVRVMTAVMASALVLATAGWVYNSLAVINLPMPTWVLQLEGYRGTPPAPGQVVELHSAPDASGSTEVRGSASVLSYDPITPTTGLLRVGDIRMTQKNAIPADAGMIRVSAGSGAGGEPAGTAFVVSAQGEPIFQLLYLQAGAASIVLLLGVVLIYWYVGRKPASVDFLIATDGEMKKVNWSTRKEIIGSTWVVIAASVLIAAFLFAADFIFSEIMTRIGVIER
jgi:preprotein translocase SecE subunit